MLDEFDREFAEWPSAHDDRDTWIRFAVHLGVARRAAESMSKTDLIKSLNRLDTTE